MANPNSMPWAILLCKFSDDPNDPTQTRIKDLAAQWRATQSQAFILGNLNPSWDIDNRTFLELYKAFFTVAGIFTLNVVDYFDSMSHGLVDVTGNQVFPCTLDITAAQGLALANDPGGKAYQDAIFSKAKNALLQQHGVNWTDFYGVAVSFQSADFGSQGSLDFDGGPGVYMDIRFVVNNGTARWGHEMGHGFGLEHSRTDGQFTSNCTGGDPSDYTDPWDIMSIACAFSAADGLYGLRGPGMNAWNMRHMNGLDESRIWKGPNGADFSETITLNPLHWRNKQGFLGAELPGIGQHSSYLVEFRVPVLWDTAINQPKVIVHRFEDTHSYIMKGTKGQKGLASGDVFESGSGPISRVKVVSIDSLNGTATIQLCYSSQKVIQPTVSIRFEGRSDFDACAPALPVAGSEARFNFKLSGVICNMGYQVMWSVSGADPVGGQTNSGQSFSIVTPDSSVAVTVSVSVFFDDGTIINDSLSFHSLDLAEAIWRDFLCKISHERFEPIPWWEWDPEKVQLVAEDYSQEQFKVIAERVELIGETLRQLGDLGRQPGR